MSGKVAYIDALIDLVFNISKVVRLFAAVGQNILDIIYGKVDPLNLFFEGASRGLLPRDFQHSMLQAD